MKAFLIVVACLALSGCATKTRTVPVATKVVVSAPCKATLPEEPAWPTETVKLDPKAKGFLDKFVALAIAEIELRDGYEGRLIAELKSCL